MPTIDPRLVLRALPEVGTFPFEKFGQQFYGSLQDREFVPLGGMHDGGAEGFDEKEISDPDLFEETETSRFLQVSKEETVRSKIRRTVKRLREYERKPKVLTYLTSRVVADIDKEEKLLSDELNCVIKIRDANFIETNINATPAIQAAFQAYLEPAIEFLYKPGTSDIGRPAPEYIADRTLAVFLRQEVESRRGKVGLLEAVADSLILWALGETDPDKGIFLNRQEILTRIEATLPAARQFIRGVIDHRLELMTARNAPGGRQVRWYKKEGNYCLPYETRLIVASENAGDDLLKIQVSCVWEDRLTSATAEDIGSIRPAILSVCHSALERTFERQGLQFAQFITNGAKDDELYTDVGRILSEDVDKLTNTSDQKMQIRQLAQTILRNVFYRSTDVERTYLLKLSRTYVLLLTLKNEPRIVEYFKSLAKNFRLYVGTDLIIRLLSEQYLAPEDQMTVNLLTILVKAGSELVLTEKTVEELSTHLRAQILEFENHYAMLERHLPLQLVEYVNRLLIRAYLYARLAPIDGIEPPQSWQAYVSQFATYTEVKSLRANAELAAYLIRRFNMTYETTDEMLAGVDTSELAALAGRILEVKKQGGQAKTEGELLAYNDALHILRIFRRRLVDKESSPANQ